MGGGKFSILGWFTWFSSSLLLELFLIVSSIFLFYGNVRNNLIKLSKIIRPQYKRGWYVFNL